MFVLNLVKHITLYLENEITGTGIFTKNIHAPDLTVCDFFLWGHMKQEIWTQPQNVLPQNLADLKIAIQNTVTILVLN